MNISEVKQEYQLQQWRGMVQERLESGLTIQAWCAANGITEHAYYYRLRKLRQNACCALEQARPDCLAEVPLVPKSADSHPQFRLTTAAATLEISNAGSEMLDQILRVLLHVE